jgi:hypothetical protein
MSSAMTVEYAAFPSLGVYRSRTREHPRPKVTAPLQVDAATNEYDGVFAGHFAKLDKIEVTPSLWVDGAEHPDALALAWARYVLQRLQEDDLPPTRVVASAEGGIAICFVKGDKYADIECLNNGEMLGVTTNRRHRPSAWQIEPDGGAIARAVARVRMFLDSHSARENVSLWPWRR